MQKTLTPAANDAVALLRDALATGRTVMVSLAAPPHVDRVPPQVSACSLLFGLTEAEARVLVALALAEHGFVSREGLHAAMYRDGRAMSKPNTLGVVVYRIRRKLAGHGIAIENLWGQGFRLTANARDKLRKVLAGHGIDIANAATPIETGPNPV